MSYKDVLIQSSAAGVGSGVLTGLLVPGSMSTNVNLPFVGTDVNLPLAVGVSTALAKAADLTVKDYVIGYLPSNVQDFANSGSFVANTVVVGGASAGLFYLANPTDFNISNAAQMALISNTGAWAADYAMERLAPGISDMI